MRAVQLTIAAAAVFVAGLIAYSTVFAHADYESSVPARGEVVADSPDRVEVFFTQDVVKREGAFYVRVINEAGVQVSSGDGAVNDDDRSNVNAELPAPLDPGRYVVEWMTTSDIDGDTDEGAFCFYVSVEPTAAQEAECAEFEDTAPPSPTQDEPEPAEPTSTPTAPVDDPEDDDSGSNTGLIAGVIVAIVAVVGVVAGVLVWVSRRE